ncbi:MAG: hypothetical protein Q9191_003701, partial [Dirinaria sp. TL-2023a]
MSSKTSKKRIANVTDGEDEPNKLRFHSTPRDRYRTPRLPRSSTIKKGQKTLTQIQFVPSSRTIIDDVDLEYEESPVERQSTRRRRKTRKPVQSDTLTQMDFLLPASPGKENDEIVEDELAHDPLMPLRTRSSSRAIREVPLARAIHKPTAKRRAMEQLNFSDDESALLNPPAQQNASAVPRQDSTPATPPRPGPRMWRREIPSSQSPPDTPLSARARRSSREPSRSPLRERSLNVRNPIRTTSKAAMPPRRQEVADSMDSENEGSSVSPQLEVTSTPSRICYMQENLRVRTQSQMTDDKGAAEHTSTSTLGQHVSGGDTGIPRATQIKSEVEELNEEARVEDLNEPNLTGAEASPLDTTLGSRYNSSPQSSEEGSAKRPLTSNTTIEEFGMPTVRDQDMSGSSPHRLRRTSSELSIPDFNDASPDDLALGREAEDISDSATASTPARATETLPPPLYQFTSSPLRPETDSQ